MDINACQWVLGLKDVPPTTKHVLLVLAWHLNSQTGQCNPSIQTLTEDTGWKRDAIMSAIKKAEQLGLLTVKRGNGKGSSYKLLVGTGNQWLKSTGRSGRPDQSAKPTTTGRSDRPNQSVWPTLNINEVEEEMIKEKKNAPDGASSSATETTDNDDIHTDNKDQDQDPQQPIVGSTSDDRDDQQNENRAKTTVQGSLLEEPTIEQNKAKTKAKAKKTKEEVKRAYDEFGLVLLTEQEYDKLIDRLGEAVTKDLIERLALYMGSKGVKFKSHYMTILNWARRNGVDQAQGQIVQKMQPNPSIPTQQQQRPMTAYQAHKLDQLAQARWLNSIYEAEAADTNATNTQQEANTSSENIVDVTFRENP